MYNFDSDFLKLRALDSASDEAITIRGRLAECNQNLVRSLAYQTGPKLGVSGGELDDLIGEGNIALMGAIDDFNPSLGFAFSSYATQRIEGAFRMYVRDKQAIIREPAWHQQKRRNEGIEDAPVVAESHGLPGQRHEDIPCTLDRADDVESFVTYVEARATLDLYLEELNCRIVQLSGRQRDALEKQRRVLAMHFKGKPAIEIARRLDISMSNVSYHLKNGIAEFRKFIDGGE